MIKVYAVKFTFNGKKYWLRESLDRDTAIEICKVFRDLGRNPVLYRIVVDPKQLLKISKGTLACKRV